MSYAGHSSFCYSELNSRRTLLILFFLWAVLAPVACRERGTPTPLPFSLGERIPIGSSTIVISHSDAELTKGKLKLTVYFRWYGGGRWEELMIKFAETLSVVANTGGTYRPSGDDLPDLPGFWERVSGVMPADLYRMSRYGLIGGELVERLKRGEAPEEWVALFDLPYDSQGLTLTIKNFDKRNGQPDIAAISLGR